uniref:Helicase C-terminal domain-containing protein n=2 Tax=Zooxanthella nutricula TaxID=1333877 RepID=A0A7S2LYA7_9DINO
MDLVPHELPEAVAGKDAQEAPSGKKRRPSIASHDIRTFFDGSRPAPPPSTIAGGLGFAGEDAFHGDATSEGGKLNAFKLTRASPQEVSERALAEKTTLDKMEMSAPVVLESPREFVPLLVSSVPLLPSGNAIFGQLPAAWLDFSDRSDAMGTRCLFASRRHEHSVFENLPPECLLQVPSAASEWQPPLQVPSASDAASAGFAGLASEEPWAVHIHPGHKKVRVLVRPGVLLQRMLRRGTALPAARFEWRVTQASGDPRQAGAPAAERPAGSSAIGEFSILSNIEDAAYTQPPHFVEFPLRREQLRSLGWMVAQEQRRREPFVTELREAAPCPDAAHWRLEGCLRCDYQGVKGGVLADAIGYGKTACTIGLVDCTLKHPLPRVPPAFAGFIPSRATLILVPTNLHSQWLAEIRKFTGDTFKVLSVPTCTQLKRLSINDLREADVVVATYRLFYSTPYLRRLQEVARTQKPGFVLPRLPTGQNIGQTGGAPSRGAPPKTTADWARSYRCAFEALPAWAQGRPDGAVAAAEPVTPVKALDATQPALDTAATQQASRRRATGKAASAGAHAVGQEAAEGFPGTQAEDGSGKRRRLQRKQQVADMPEEWSQASQASQADAADAAAGAAAAGGAAPPKKGALLGAGTHFPPLEAFWWRRVVCDEFHELLSRYPPAQVAVELFHGDYKWGLSGTPPCQTLAQIRKAAGFLGVQLPTAAAEESGGEAPRQVAQEWLDAFVRRNTTELPPLDEEEQIIPVHQTPQERALYMALTRQHDSLVASTQTLDMGAAETMPGLEAMPEVQAARRSASGLLKLCSHFSMSGTASVLTAGDECQRQLALRRERVRAAERDARTLAERAANTAKLIRHFEPHFGRKPVRENYGFVLKETRNAVAARLRFLGVSLVGTKAELLGRLLGPAAGAGAGEDGAVAEASEAAKARVLSADFDFKRDKRAVGLDDAAPSKWLELEKALTAAKDQAEHAAETGEGLVEKAVRRAIQAANADPAPLPARCAKLRSNLGMPRWAGPSGTAKADLEEANWAWLGDRENADKLRKVIDAWKADIESCAAQLNSLKAEAGARLKALSSFQESLSDTQAAPGDVVEERPQHVFAKYGSKIEALVTHVQKLRREDPSHKIICFVQWEDLKRKIGSALEEFGVEHLSLHGSVWARRAALTRFQFDEGSPRMLLLSLEESASGTNLTAANHVIIVHPMEAATKEEAVAFEMQAVGRVRRPGQQRKIHIWRFVTVDTIEQIITEGHQKELWERQQVKISVSQTEPLIDEAEDLHEAEFEEEGAVENSWDVQAAEMATQRYLGPSEPQQAMIVSDAEQEPMEADTLPASVDELPGSLHGAAGAALGPMADMGATQAY